MVERTSISVGTPLMIRCQSAVDPLSIRCRSAVDPLSIRCRSAVDLSGHCFFGSGFVALVTGSVEAKKTAPMLLEGMSLRETCVVEGCLANAMDPVVARVVRLRCRVVTILGGPDSSLTCAQGS